MVPISPINRLISLPYNVWLRFWVWNAEWCLAIS